MADLSDPRAIAARLTRSDLAALRALPRQDTGHFPDELWWAYCYLLGEGLAASGGNFTLVLTPLGSAVLEQVHRLAAD